MMKKYEPLRAYLANLEPDVTEVELSFSAIESIIRDALPASASIHREWWSNEADPSHGQKQAWRDAGWRTGHVSLARGLVIFRRTGDGTE